MEKPSWWPKNPYPKDIFPMPEERYSEIVPNPKMRTALSGMLGRRFWNIASEAIWEAMIEAIEEGRLTSAEPDMAIRVPAEDIDGLDNGTEQDLLDPDFPCPICGGTVGHRINCPRGIAFSKSPRGLALSLAPKDHVDQAGDH